jgi:hypothetical protein
MTGEAGLSELTGVPPLHYRNAKRERYDDRGTHDRSHSIRALVRPEEMGTIDKSSDISWTRTWKHCAEIRPPPPRMSNC